MQVAHFGSAAQSRSKHDFALQVGLEQEQPTSSKRMLNPGPSNPDLRANVERQFIQMNDVHDRIREEFLGTSQEKPTLYAVGESSMGAHSE